MTPTYPSETTSTHSSADYTRRNSTRRSRTSCARLWADFQPLLTANQDTWNTLPRYLSDTCPHLRGVRSYGAGSGPSRPGITTHGTSKPYHHQRMYEHEVLWEWALGHIETGENVSVVRSRFDSLLDDATELASTLRRLVKGRVWQNSCARWGDTDCPGMLRSAAMLSQAMVRQYERMKSVFERYGCFTDE
jgi:hypothetical protein